MSPVGNVFKREPFQFTTHADWQDGKLQTEVTFDVPKKNGWLLKISAQLTSVRLDRTLQQLKSGL